MFEGFRPQAIDFLWCIRFNNNREWFADHKQEYTRELNNPLKAMAQALYAPYCQNPNLIMKVCRILRDTRMHYDLPYRDSLWLSLRPRTEEWYRVPNLYFSIRPEGVEYGLSLWRPEPAQMELFRKTVSADPDAFLSALEATERATGEKVTADCYKRPKPCENPDLLPFFSWKTNVSCFRQEPVGPGIFEPELADRVGTFWAGTRPLFDFFDTMRPIVKKVAFSLEDMLQ